MTDDSTESFSMTIQELPAALEAILFASGDPVSLSRLQEITAVQQDVLLHALSKMILDYENNPWSGLLIRRLDNEYVMCTKPQMKYIFERMFLPKSRPPMSQAKYETLAVIAYN